MLLKFLLKVTYRIRGLKQVFEPGEEYDIDPAVVGSLGLLSRTDGWGGKVFEAVKPPPKEKDTGTPVPTPEDVFAANQKVREEAIAKEQAERTAKRKAEAEKQVTDRKAKATSAKALSRALKGEEKEPEATAPVEPSPPPPKKAKDKPPTKGALGRSKLSDKLKSSPH